MNDRNHRTYDVAVVGGGLAGLTAAALLGRAGKNVVMYERRNALGGRAGTAEVDGFHFNLGPHALYRAGHAMRVLEQLGIRVDEPPVGGSGSIAVRDGQIFPLPVDLPSMFRSRLLTFAARLELVHFLATVPGMDTNACDHLSVQQWLNGHIRTPEARTLIASLLRVATYTNAPDELSAGAALHQLRLALRSGVVYLNGGWQTLVDRLRDAALAAGVVIHTGTAVDSLDTIPTDTFVLAVPPKTVAKILGKGTPPDLLKRLQTIKPVRVACLDLGLRSLPEPNRTFAVGIDEPIYFSVHSRWAELAPAGKVLVHVAKYVPWGEETDPAKDREQLARFLDLVQPEWWREVEHERFMPRLTVSESTVRAVESGVAGRPAVDAAAAEGVYLAGDWVGNEGMLCDAAFASACRAAQLIVSNRRPILKLQTV